MLLVPLALAADPPEPSVPRGLYDAPFDLELSGDGAIRYSLDGSAPTLEYSGPIAITGTTTVRAAVGDSAIATWTYLFPTAIQAGLDPTITSNPTYAAAIDHTLRTLPSISVVLPGALAFDVEQAVSVEWIDPDGDDDQVDCGAEIIGGTSYIYDKTSVRLHFRSEYGASKWDFDLYGDGDVGVAPATSFDALTLRSGNHDSVFYLGSAGQYTRNYWMDQTQLEMGRLDAHGRYIHVYVNGNYRGLYHLRERFDAAFMAEYLGGEEEDYEAVNGGTAFDGSGAAWNSVVGSTSSFEDFSQWVDVADFLDYMVLNYYAANSWDWSYNHNWVAAGPNEPGRGGFRFHNGDSDICLYYDPSTNILSNGGPSNLFAALLAEGDPAFRVALADAIHRNLEDGGPLTVEAATARYQRIAEEADEGIVAESARWGGGWWDHDEEWVTERDWLLNTFFAQRTAVLLQQVRDAGWYPLPAPTIDGVDGLVAPGTEVGVHGVGELWVTVDGTDPQEAEGATGPDVEQSIVVEHGATVKARLRSGDTWGPLAERVVEVDEDAPIVLNEWNVVEPDRQLSDGDTALGTVDGNGGDWIELLVVQDHLDLRGWELRSRDLSGVEHVLRFGDAAPLDDLRAGTLITIAQELPEDAAYDPAHGDWRFHLRVGGAYVIGDALEITSHDWQLRMVDADGWERVGPVGEGVNPARGLSGDEVGVLGETPGPGWRRWSAAYADARGSTFGAANPGQDLARLRGGGAESAVGAEATVEREEAPEPGGCGCATGGGGGWIGLLAALGLFGRRSPPRSDATHERQQPKGVGYCSLLLRLMSSVFRKLRLDPTYKVIIISIRPLVGCAGEAPESEPTPTPDCPGDRDHDGARDEASDCPGDLDCAPDDPTIHPGAAETCDGIDQDCDGVVDNNPIDGLPFYEDADGDGYGGTTTTACTRPENAVTTGDDCDDNNPDIHPGATEHCDDLDEDCDGQAGREPGASSECPATSCAEVGVEGAWWVALPSGSVAQLWCDADGWTLGFLRNTASTGSQGDFGSGEVGLDQLGQPPEAASLSSTPALSWIDLNTFPYTDLRLAAYLSGAVTYTSRDIPRAELRIAFGDDGYKLYGGNTGYYWCGGAATYTDSGVGAVNNPDGTYPDCKGHGSLGSGWDFSEADYGNAGLTLCGGDGSYFLAGTWGGSWTYYGAPGAAQAIWVR